MSLAPASARRLLWALLLISLSLTTSVWAAKPTISGVLKHYNPGGGRFQIVRDDGVTKTVIMRPGCQFMMSGQKVSSSAFRPNMRVCVRICGSVMDNPLECDLVADFMSSKNVVARRASSPNPTQVGGFAGTAGPAATLTTLFNNPNVMPNVSGPLGIGGQFPAQNFPSSDPTQIAQGATPAQQTNPQVDANLANPANPYKQGTAAPGAVQPIGTTVGPGQFPGGVAPGAGNPASLTPNPYQVSNPYASNSYDPTNPGGLPSMSDLLNGSDEDDEDDGAFIKPPSGPFSMQLVNFTGRIVQADVRTRSITIMPNGQAQTVQVLLPQMVAPTNAQGQAIDFGALQPGLGISVQGVANTAGIVEARQVLVGL